MTRRFLISTAVVTGLLLSPAVFAADSTVVAKVDGKNVTYGDVMKMKEVFGKKAQGIPDDKLFPILQNQLVTELALNKAVAESKIAENPVVKEALAKLKEQLYREAYVSEKLKNEVTEADIKKKFEEVIANFPKEKEAKLRHIVVKDEKTAKQIVKALKNGGDFAKLAKDKSEDKTTSKQGGEIGFLAKDRLPKSAREAVYALKAGAYTVDPIKTDLGWHVFKVDQYRDRKPPKFEEAKDEVTAMLVDEALIKLHRKLFKESNVVLFTQDGKPMPEKKPADAKPAEAAKSPTSK